jgi:hypothetical protein
MAAQAKPKPTSAPPMRSKVLQRKCACCGALGPTGECDECRKNRKSKNDQFSEIPPIVHEVLNCSGQQLDPATRAFMEPRFGHDFGNVRVHTDARAADSARAVYAHAYTVGQDVVFGTNEFAPATREGRELLAHELAHTIQQRRDSSTVQLVPPGSVLEAKAEQAGRDVTSCRVMTEPLGLSELAVARQPVAAHEEEEEEKEEETPTPMALPTGKASTAAPLTKASSAKPPRRRPASQFEPGGVPYHVTDDGRLLTELEWSLELSSRREEEGKKDREQKELRQSHDRLLTLRGMLDRSGYSYSKSQIVAMLTEYSLLDWQIVRHYGVDPPHWYTKRITFTKDVIAAIDKFDNEWGHGAASAGPADIEGLQARQTQQENEAASWEGYSYTTESTLAGAGASATRLFTDDPKKIAAGAGLGAATEGVLFSVATAKATQIEQTAVREASKTAPAPPVAAEPKAKAEPRKETIADFVKRGGVVKEVKKGPEPKTVTAVPKSGPTTPEGFGDIFEQTDVSETKTPGGKAPKQRTEAGQFAHQYYEKVDDMMMDFTRSAEQFVEEVPRGPGVKKEFAIDHPDYPKGRQPRIDRLDWENAEIYEIKPDTPEWIAKGKAQAQQYAEWMNKYHKRADGKVWKVGKNGGVITYDQGALLNFLKSKGYLPKRKRNKGSE